MAYLSGKVLQAPGPPLTAVTSQEQDFEVGESGTGYFLFQGLCYPHNGGRGR